MACGMTVVGHVAQGPCAASGMLGMTYCCGIICGTIAGAHVAHGDGAQGDGAQAATGAAITGGGHTGAGGGHGAGRLNQLHGQQAHNVGGQHAAQPLKVAGRTATASKVNVFFMILCLLRKQSGDYCLNRVV
jgi:hypothetical protein